jgi:hypothetical protein
MRVSALSCICDIVHLQGKNTFNMSVCVHVLSLYCYIIVLVLWHSFSFFILIRCAQKGSARLHNWNNFHTSLNHNRDVNLL